LSRYLPGAFATQMLGDLGADVIKIEGYPEGDYARGMKPYSGFNSINRNKRSLQIDMNREDGRKAVRRILTDCSVLVESSRPGAMKPWGLDYESVRLIRPDIIYCSITAFGQFGPLAETPAHGYNIDAAAGMLAVELDRHGAPFVGPAGHLMPASLLGAHSAALGICAALFQRHLTGLGSHIDASCWDAAISGDPIGSAGAITGETMEAGFASRSTPKYAPYRTADGRFLMLCVIEPKYWRRFCELVGRADMIDAFTVGHADDLGKGADAIYHAITEIIAARTFEEWAASLEGAGIPATPVMSREEALASAHADARGICPRSAAGTPGFPRFPLLFDGHSMDSGMPAPGLGAHTSEVLLELGWSRNELDELHRTGCIQAEGASHAG